MTNWNTILTKFSSLATPEDVILITTNGLVPFNYEVTFGEQSMYFKCHEPINFHPNNVRCVKFLKIPSQWIELSFFVVRGCSNNLCWCIINLLYPKVPCKFIVNVHHSKLPYLLSQYNKALIIIRLRFISTRSRPKIGHRTSHVTGDVGSCHATGATWDNKCGVRNKIFFSKYLRDFSSFHNGIWEEKWIVRDILST